MNAKLIVILDVKQKIEKKQSIYLLFQILSLPLHRFVPRTPLARERMKRESGESPEQSRCCKPHRYRSVYLQLAPLPI